MMTRAAVGEHLLDYEHERLAVHRHKIVVVGPVIVAVVAGIATIRLPQLLIIAGIAWIWAGWRILNWYSTWFVLTTKRIIYARGVFTHDIDQTSLVKISDMKKHQTSLGQWFGWWKFIDMAGGDQALSVVNFLPYPYELYLEITNQVFADTRNEVLRGTAGLAEGMPAGAGPREGEDG